MRVALNRVFCFYLRVFWFLNNAATDRTHTIFDKTRKTLYTPASSARFVTYRMFVKPLFFLNLPGWRWGSITQNPLVAVSRPLHSGVCETRQDIGLPVLHSEISDSGLLRTRGDQQTLNILWISEKWRAFLIFCLVQVLCCAACGVLRGDMFGVLCCVCDCVLVIFFTEPRSSS